MCWFLCSRHSILPCYAMAKQLHFNKDGSALKKMQAGVDKLASVVGITLGPKVRLSLAFVTDMTYMVTPNGPHTVGRLMGSTCFCYYPA